MIFIQSQQPQQMTLYRNKIRRRRRRPIINFVIVTLGLSLLLNHTLLLVLASPNPLGSSSQPTTNNDAVIIQPNNVINNNPLIPSTPVETSTPKEDTGTIPIGKQLKEEEKGKPNNGINVNLGKSTPTASPTLPKSSDEPIVTPPVSEGGKDNKSIPSSTNSNTDIPTVTTTSSTTSTTATDTHTANDNNSNGISPTPVNSSSNNDNKNRASFDNRNDEANRVLSSASSSSSSSSTTTTTSSPAFIIGLSTAGLSLVGLVFGVWMFRKGAVRPSRQFKSRYDPNSITQRHYGNGNGIDGRDRMYDKSFAAQLRQNNIST